MRNFVKCFRKIQKNHVDIVTTVYTSRNNFQKRQQVSQTGPSLPKSMLGIHQNLMVLKMLDNCIANQRLKQFTNLTRQTYRSVVFSTRSASAFVQGTYIRCSPVIRHNTLVHRLPEQ